MVINSRPVNNSNDRVPAMTHLAVKHAQRGAVMIMTVGFMLLGILCLALVIDTGRLYLEKRNLQRIADIAAIEAASRGGCYPEDRLGTLKKWRQEDAQASATRNGFSGTISASCGTLVSGNVRSFSLNEADGTAVRVIASKAVARSLITGGQFVGTIPLTATAVATKGGNPLASLTIRSTTLTVDTQKSQLLNAVLGGLLGTSLNVSAAGYNGLIQSKVNTLALVNGIAVELQTLKNTDGSVEQALSTPLTLGEFLGVVIAVVNKTGTNLFNGVVDLGGVVAGLGDILSALSGATNSQLTTTLSVAELLSISTTTDDALVAIETNLFDLVQGRIQVLGKDSLISANLPVNLFGLSNATLKLKVIEPAQLSAIGDPSEINASLGADDPNAIFVRTAQVRTLIKLDLAGVVNVTSGLLNAVSGALSPLVNFLNTNISGLGLITGLGNLLQDLIGFVLTACTNNCAITNVIDARGGAIEIGLDVGGAKSYVSDYSCGSNKSLSAQASTEVAHIYIGKINESDLFSATKNPSVEVFPAPLIELGYKRVRPFNCFKILGLIGGCGGVSWQQPNGSWLNETSNNNAKGSAKLTVIAGLGVKADSAIGSSNKSLSYTMPPDIGETPSFQGISGSNFVGSLSNTIAGLEIKAYSESNGLLGGLLTGSFSLLNGLVATLGPVLSTLGSVLDPLVNTLLNGLGVNVAQADVGANLTCDSDQGVRLVN